MQVQRQSNGQRLTLDPTSTLGAGGEARIYTVAQDRSVVAKMYHTPTPAHARKLAAMLANPPDDPMAAQGHISIAWPLDVLYTTDGRQRVVGFLMPYVSRMRPVVAYYNPLTRRQRCPLFNYRYLHRTAHNLAAAMRALHTRGYVIGDVNESNILVTDTALVTLVDTDSFQVREPHNGVVYHCPVGKPEFTPPELQGHLFTHLDRAPEHDLFGLAVLIFQLLMEGTHPFAGVFSGPGDPPPYEVRVAAGHFPYSREHHGPYRPMPSAPPSDILHPTLQELLMRCFEEGHRHPQLRPAAQTWQRALQEAENALVSCSRNDQHVYDNHLRACPWCLRAMQLKGRDPFPSRQAVQRQHALPLPAPRRLSRVRSAFTGALWGGVSAVLLGAIVHVIFVSFDPHIPQDVTLSVIGETVWKAGWGVVWGAVWGAMWGACRLPLASGVSRRLGGMITGAMLGACLGIVSSAIVGVTPGSLVDTHRSTFLEVLTGAQWRAWLSTAQEILLGFIRSAQPHVIPGAVVGTLLGVVWGACGK